MRSGIGSALIVLFFALIILGFLLSDTINTHKELNAVRQEIAQARQINQKLQEQLNTANENIEALKAQNVELGKKALGWQEQARQLEEQKQTLEEKIANLERQVIAMQSASTNNIESPKKTTNPLVPAFLVPFLPVAIGATYVVTRQTTKSSIQKNQRTRLNNTQRGNMVRLSDDEMKEIIKIRRGNES